MLLLLLLLFCIKFILVYGEAFFEAQQGQHPRAGGGCAHAGAWARERLVGLDFGRGELFQAWVVFEWRYLICKGRCVSIERMRKVLGAAFLSEVGGDPRPPAGGKVPPDPAIKMESWV
jgi:hypothetical protein